MPHSPREHEQADQDLLTLCRRSLELGDAADVRGAELHIAQYKLLWRPDTMDFADESVEFRKVHRGAQKVVQIGGLRAGSRYRLKARTFNSTPGENGHSAWSEVVEFEIKRTQAGA